MGGSGEVTSVTGLESFSKFFREVGFPAAVACFVLWRVDDRLARLEVAAEAQVRLLAAMSQRVCVPGVPVAPRSDPSTWRDGAVGERGERLVVCGPG